MKILQFASQVDGRHTFNPPDVKCIAVLDDQQYRKASGDVARCCVHIHDFADYMDDEELVGKTYQDILQMSMDANRNLTIYAPLLRDAAEKLYRNSEQGTPHPKDWQMLRLALDKCSGITR